MFQWDGTKGRGYEPTWVFGLYTPRYFMEEAVLLLWDDGCKDRYNNSGCSNNNMDWYNITYWGRRCCIYHQIWWRRDLLEVVRRNYR